MKKRTEKTTTTSSTPENKKEQVAEATDKPANEPKGTLSGLRFEKGVVGKFIAASAAVILLPILATYGMHKALEYAEGLQGELPGALGVLRSMATSKFAANNKLVVSAVFGMAVAILVQVVYVIVSICEDSASTAREDKIKKNQ